MVCPSWLCCWISNCACGWHFDSLASTCSSLSGILLAFFILSMSFCKYDVVILIISILIFHSLLGQNSSRLPKAVNECYSFLSSWNAYYTSISFSTYILHLLHAGTFNAGTCDFHLVVKEGSS